MKWWATFIRSLRDPRLGPGHVRRGDIVNIRSDRSLTLWAGKELSMLDSSPWVYAGFTAKRVTELSPGWRLGGTLGIEFKR
jgi:hypothetical protein